ncbi:MAG: hypothetical protein A2Y17_13650 [Clostridiales bacterium GWF2_38_85]|nr:MAG: hypothetical protein A2Y17_13650 [Clostridiales bacterium GWF2_38_85]
MVLSDKTEIKTFILFLMSNIKEALDFNTLHDIVVQDGFVKYIDFLDCFAELLEAGQVDEINNDIPLYTISDNGKIAVAELTPKLFGTIKEKALRSAMRLLAFYREGSRIFSSVNSDGEGWQFHCEMTDGKRKLLEINTYYTDYDYAQRVKSNFDENAEKIYKGTMAILSGDVNYIFDK